MSEHNYWTRRRVSRRAALRGAGLAAAGLAGAALIGCGGGSSTPTPTSSGGGGSTGTAAPASTSAPTQAASNVKRGGHLKVAYTLEPSTLDPDLAVSGGDDLYARPMFDYLLARDQDDKYDPGRSLAPKYELPDDTTLVLHLRDGVKFHDGNPFTSSDVKWNIERIQDENLGSVSRQSYLVIDHVETPDDQTAKLVLSRPAADLLINLGGRGGQVLSPKAVEKEGKQFGNHPVGTGPFVFDEFVSGSHLTVKQNPDYWRKDANGIAIPYLDQLTINVIPDATTRLASLSTGDVDISPVDPKDVSQAKGNSSLNMVTRKGTYTASTIVQNPDVPPFDNVDLRRALVWSLNPAAVNKAVYFDQFAVADAGVSPPATWAYEPVPGRPTYDPQKAKQYLANAGHPDGITLDVDTYSSPNIVQQTQIYLEQWKAVGITPNVHTADVGTATKEFFQAKQYGIYSTSWGAGSAPDGLFRGILGDGAFYNPSTQKNPKIENLLDQADKIYDQEQRKQLYLQINQVSLDEALWVPMIYGSSIAAINQRVQNQDLLWFGLAGWRFQDLWLKS